uniref:Uncharacterized protein n=1 Tax=Clastoptera arizonana TaxID=38151 RepID=A0A1B6C269_9HEMI
MSSPTNGEKGDYNHNKEVIATGEGELILVRRPTDTEKQMHTFEDYGLSTNCLGFMLKVHLWHHYKYSCQAKAIKENSNSVRVGSDALLAAGIRKSYSPEFEEKVIGKLTKDIVGKGCLNQEMLLRYGDYLFQKNLTIDSNQRAKNSRSAMRILLNLFLNLTDKLEKNASFKSKIHNIVEIFNPTLFNIVVDSVKEMCNFTHKNLKSQIT